MTGRSGLVIEYVIGSGQIGGAESQLVTLCAHLLQAGHHPRVLFLQRTGPIVDQLAAIGVPTAGVRHGGRSVPVIGGLATLAEYRRFGRQGHRPPDIVHALMDGAIAASTLLHPEGTPIVAGILGMRVPRPRRFDPAWDARLRLLGRTLRTAAAVVCNAPHLKADIEAQFALDPARVHVIPNGVDIPQWSADPAPQPPSAVVVANFHPYPGHDVLLTALRGLDDPPVVRLCGTGETRADLVTAAVDLPSVEFVDPPADVPAELHRAQFAIHPSRTEGLSNAILEEMAAGLPVIACDVGGNPLLVEDGVTGVLVPAGDAVALGRAITRLVQDPESRVAMGRAGRTAAARHSWPACTQAHVDLYTEVLSARGAPATRPETGRGR
jgi:glycosyltransferase involved in cell wall biosynthesis